MCACQPCYCFAGTAETNWTHMSSLAVSWICALTCGSLKGRCSSRSKMAGLKQVRRQGRHGMIRPNYRTLGEACFSFPPCRHSNMRVRRATVRLRLLCLTGPKEYHAESTYTHWCIQLFTSQPRVWSSLVPWNCRLHVQGMHARLFTCIPDRSYALTGRAPPHSSHTCYEHTCTIKIK